MSAVEYAETFDRLAPPELDLGYVKPEGLPERITTSRGAHPVPSTPDPFKVLLSFHYFRNTDLDKLAASFPQGAQFIADSGAFSALTQGLTIDLPMYQAWIDRWAHLLVGYSNLDVIGDPVGTAMNQRQMETAGYDPFPVFHVGEDFAYLEAYCEQYPFVALGGMVGYRSEFLPNWLARCFKVAEKTGTAFHGFGQTRTELLDLFPFHSCDSTSWLSGTKFGLLSLWDPDAGRMIELDYGKNVNHDEVWSRGSLIWEHGADPIVFIDKEQYHHHHAIRVNAWAWYQMAQHLRAKHGPVPREGQPDGLHLYFVETSLRRLALAATHIHES